ncbi:DUF1194 domain-containing protein [Rhodovulum marinum]|uniref:Uncharacterized protein DUF1194 n=1 Tax=Rhodovulum marinum TaxID=320662 RepID=A0A4R2PYQ3_9RHOB|nr:DUF1194 domain-containing protein [Rhodovulum marinum]TCP41393.1 uncharacterized protein DUF1194 [Rhodovulum marinum]
MRAAALALALTAGAAQADCRQALAIGLDVSGSVDAREYRLQIDGLAGALNHPEVRAALLQMPNAPVALAVYEWSGAADQRLVLPWTAIDGPETLAAVAARLRGTARAEASRTTAIGAALMRGAALLAERPECWRHTLDLTGDGKSNEGPRPREVPAGAETVNALVIGIESAARMDHAEADLAELTAYFHAEVIRGPEAFVETAQGFADFEAAMVRKLLRELQTVAVGAARAAPYVVAKGDDR